MNLEILISKPWSSESLAKSYTSSLLHLSPAPEYANGEVVLASLYRSVSSNGPKDQAVPTLGREFERRVKRGHRTHNEYGIVGLDSDDWYALITGALKSPKQPNQATSRHLQISPVVPDATIYSLSARQSANSWDAGKLVAKMVMLGCESFDDATKLWTDLFNALKVSDEDELWAKFLDLEFRSWRTREFENFFNSPSTLEKRDYFDFLGPVDFPAKQFVADLKAVIQLKKHLTRRQWVSMMESLLRIATASHVFWTASLNINLFEALKKIMSDRDTAKAKADFWQRMSNPNFFSYGQYSARAIKAYSTGYLKARVGINLLVHLINEKQRSEAISFENIDKAIDDIFKRLAPEVTSRFWIEFQTIIESDSRIVQGKKGTASNVSEFLRHVLGKRQTSETGLASYDQGYFLAKRGGGAWEVSMGPVSVLTLVHACTHEKSGSSNIEDLFMHISRYGIELTIQDLKSSSLETTLRSLGLVVDSPDAEGGMMLLSPFESLLKGDA
jgi:hypothetical protein